MGLFDFLKVNEFKNEINRLSKELTELKNTFTPEMRDAKKALDLKATTEKEIRNLEIKKQEVVQSIDNLKAECENQNSILLQKKALIIETDERLLFQEFGLYEPKYDFTSSDKYKDALSEIRDSQKAMIKAGTAVVGAQSWTVNGNATQGKKMIKDMQKLLLRAFNSECDELVANVKYNTY